MKVSINQIKRFIDFELPPIDELVSRINQQLGGVEEVIELGDKYKDAVIVKVVECEKHPNADKLNVTKIDDGGAVSDIPRDENGLVEVVCGAPNVHADMLAVWLPPRSVVPASYDDDEPFVLGARELRGIVSQGMLAATDELAIGSDHAGILEIDPSQTNPANVEIKSGAKFAVVFGLNDTIIDIENKMFTHRPDLFGQLGVAREIAGIFGHEFSSPEWYAKIPQFENANTLSLETFDETPEKVPRAMFVAMENIEIKPSPLWLQCALIAMGSKPINNVVDITNYIMLLTAQPVHAYDYDKIRGRKIGARLARNGETLKLLNDKTYELSQDDIVIADGEGPIGLAGIMGGGESEVSAETKSIVLEVATFDMYAVRKSSMRHGVFTDALTRFNKGQSPLQNNVVLHHMMQLMSNIAGAKQASGVSDLGNFDNCIDTNGLHKVIQHGITTDFINVRLGLELSHSDIAELLKNVEFKIDSDETGLNIYEPFWRTDIELPEDVVEEVGRLHGFDKLPRELPKRSAKPTAKNRRRELKNRLRNTLRMSGANELLTYSFVHEKLLEKVGQNLQNAFRISNALSPDLQYYRMSVLPSLLDKVNANIRAGYDEFLLYEIGKGHDKNRISSDKLPAELEMCDAVYARKSNEGGAPYFRMQKIVATVCKELGIDVRFRPISTGSSSAIAAPFELARSAYVETVDGAFIGIVGELTAKVIKRFKLPEYSAAMSLGIEGLENALTRTVNAYQPLSRYPSVTQDISLRVPTTVSYETISKSLDEVASERSDLRIDISPLAVYQSEQDTSKKTITFRVHVISDERTLEEIEVTTLLDRMAERTVPLEAEKI